jgi:hypothetical protein
MPYSMSMATKYFLKKAHNYLRATLINIYYVDHPTYKNSIEYRVKEFDLGWQGALKVVMLELRDLYGQ